MISISPIKDEAHLNNVVSQTATEQVIERIATNFIVSIGGTPKIPVMFRTANQAKRPLHAQMQHYPSQRTAVEWRTEQAYAIKMCVQAVDRLFSACGGSAWLKNNPLQRLFRDMHITASHAYTDYDLCAQAMGRELMGLAPDPTIAPAP